MFMSFAMDQFDFYFNFICIAAVPATHAQKTNIKQMVGCIIHDLISRVFSVISSFKK